jgi:hypothetical protein
MVYLWEQDSPKLAEFFFTSYVIDVKTIKSVHLAYLLEETLAPVKPARKNRWRVQGYL